MPERPSRRAVGGLFLGLLVGIVGGWLAGLLRVTEPTPLPVPSPGTPER